MKPKITTLALAVAFAFSGAAYGQTATGTGTANSQSGVTANPVNQNNNSGTGSSSSSSGSQAGASSQTTGNSVGVTVQQDFRGPASSTVESRISGTTTENVNVHSSGTVTENHNINTNLSGTTTLKNVPNVVPPNILPTSPCMGSTSIGGSVAGFGIGGGTSWKDGDCGYRETARVFMQAGRMEDGIAVLCASEYAAAAPICKAQAKKAADEAARPQVASARQDLIRTQNDAGRNSLTNGTMSKSELDTKLTMAAMQPTKSDQKAANCAVARQAGDLILAERFGCVGGK